MASRFNFILKDAMRKFRVKFSESSLKTNESNCLECVKELTRFLDIIEFGSDISFENRYFSIQKSKNKLDSLEISQMTNVINKLIFLIFKYFIFLSYC